MIATTNGYLDIREKLRGAGAYEATIVDVRHLHRMHRYMTTN